MGGLTSKGKNEDEDDREAIAKKYEMKLRSDGTFGYSDELDRREIKWWERLFFDKRFRITYVIILGLLLGILVPFIIFVTKLESKDRTIYGSCMIEEHARFQCLINSVEIEDEDACMDALCCWQNSDDLPFKCYHSFPSAYQYTVSQTEVFNENGTTWTDLLMKPNQKNMMSDLRVRLRWVAAGHAFLEFFNPSLAQAEPVEQEGSGNKIDQTLQLSLEHAENDHFFYIRISRSDTGETIFDTRLGTVIAAKNYITLSTALPSPYFYGLKGGEGGLTSLIYGVVNGFENAELPFYISSEESGKWHGVLIETSDPMLVKVVQAPGIMFHLETDTPKIGLHFFDGPTQPEILAQLHNYIQQKYVITHPPIIPPYWGLGLHLCRKVPNISIAKKHIEELFDSVTGIPYDSDCIDENLRLPFNLNPEFENLQETLDILQSKPKRIILSQQISVPWDDDSKLPFILDASNSTNVINFMGEIDNETVKYIDPFHSYFSNVSFPLPEKIPYNGMFLVDNFPKLNNATGACSDPKTRVQSLFTIPTSNSNSTIDTSKLWGTVCPQAVHDTTIGNKISNSTHLKLHNIYGHQSLKLIHESILSNSNDAKAIDDVLITSASVWITSMYYGGFRGLQVPFTWRGLQDSVSYTVRNYVLAPIIGTPICGSSVFNTSVPFDEDLCLRWFQFGLLLPLSINSYDGNSSYGPNHLSDQYKDYLTEAIKQRYTMAPYYYTLLRQYQKKYIPYLRPMSYDFSTKRDKNMTMPLLNQFMIGDAILAAPIMDRAVTRSAYFPAGMWYTKEGLKAWNNDNVGSSQFITGHITETPIFFRGGHIIPTLQDVDGHRIEDSLKESFTLLIALSSANKEGLKSSIGSLTATDGNGNFDEIEFNATYADETLTVLQTLITQTPSGESNVQSSTTVDRFRIYGLPTYGRLDITVTSEHGSYPVANYAYYGDGDQLALHIWNLNLNWKKSKTYKIILQKESDDPSTTESITSTDPPPPTSPTTIPESDATSTSTTSVI